MDQESNTPLLHLRAIERDSGSIRFSIAADKETAGCRSGQVVEFNPATYELVFHPPASAMHLYLKKYELKLKKILSTACRIPEIDDIDFPFSFYDDPEPRMRPEKAIAVYTDGSLSPMKLGGWAGIIVLPESRVIEASGFEQCSSSNRMELMAVVRILERLREIEDMYSSAAYGGENRRLPIVVHTDSMYVVKGAEVWLNNWRRNGFLTAMNRPVKNKELWHAMDSFIQRGDVFIQWISSKSGNPYHRRCDETARFMSTCINDN